jgi:endonuclease/exonuclease/phosphatase family metal-dependent hydrolase
MRVLCTTSFAFLAIAAAAATTLAQPVDILRVMTYNIWVGGHESGLPLSRTVDVIQAANADVIGIQEVSDSAQAIANELGFFYHDIDGDNAIISRYPIAEILPQGVKLQLSSMQTAYVFSVHLEPYPYEPYDIHDGLITTEAQAIASAQSSRGSTLATALSNTAAARATGAPVFLVGDFNEPSHLDWTQDAANAGLHFGMKVNWPSSRAVANAGFVDAFRQLRPDEVGDRAETWTPGNPAPDLDPGEVHDRIDFVYSTPANVIPLSAQVLGYDENDGNTDIGLDPYPSDHRAVVVAFDMPACSLLGDLNGNCGIDTADWAQLRSGQHANLFGLTPSQARAMGDLNGDFRNDHADFVIFKQEYEDSYGLGSFAQMLSVPEPASILLLAMAWFATPIRNRRGSRA